MEGFIMRVTSSPGGQIQFRPTQLLHSLAVPDRIIPMKTFLKKDYPLDEIRRYLEPGPIVLVSSAWQGKRNIMTMGWHMVMQFSPALFGCYIWDGNHSF